VNTTAPQVTVQWIYDPSTSPGHTKSVSFETPIGGLDAGALDAGSSGPSYCGKAVFTDLHTGGSLLAAAQNVPSDCAAADLTAQQKALEFLFFDLSGCVSPDTLPPPGPPPSAP
jgi:hypothetical protein